MENDALVCHKKKEKERNYHLLRHLLKDVDRDTKLIATGPQSHSVAEIEKIWCDSMHGIRVKPPINHVLKWLKI